MVPLILLALGFGALAYGLSSRVRSRVDDYARSIRAAHEAHRGIREAMDAAPDRWKLAPNLRMIVGGAAAPEQLIRDFDRLGMTLVHAWGMTEMSPIGLTGCVKFPRPSGPRLQIQAMSLTKTAGEDASAVFARSAQTRR